MCIVKLKLNQLFAYFDVRTKRGRQCCVLIPALPFQEKIINIIIHNVYFFKVRADDKFCSYHKTKEENIERETHEREEERERERERERRERERERERGR